MGHDGQAPKVAAGGAWLALAAHIAHTLCKWGLMVPPEQHSGHSQLAAWPAGSGWAPWCRMAQLWRPQAQLATRALSGRTEGSARHVPHLQPPAP